MSPDRSRVTSVESARYKPDLIAGSLPSKFVDWVWTSLPEIHKVTVAAVHGGSATTLWLSWIAYVLVGLAVLFLVGLVMSLRYTTDLPGFLYAAERVMSRDLYGSVSGELHRYFYAPWFAVALIPLTWLPVSLAAIVWHTVLALALAYSVWWMVRDGGYAAAALVAAFGFLAVWAGHPQPLIIALLVWSLPTKWGPVGVGIAASLKIVPIVLVVRYAGRGEWRSVGVALVTAAVLWAPALLYDLSLWGQVPATTLSLFSVSPILWAAVAIGCLLIAYRLAPTRYGWLAAAIAWMACMPRLLLYDVTALAMSRDRAR